MNLILLTTAATSAVAVASAFLPHASNRHHHLFHGTGLGAETTTTTATKATESEDLLLDKIAHKLRLQVYDHTTGVYGFESKDPLYGIENIHTTVSMDANGWIGLELTEVAHAYATGTDHRGLVLVSRVQGHALHGMYPSFRIRLGALHLHCYDIRLTLVSFPSDIRLIAHN